MFFSIVFFIYIYIKCRLPINWLIMNKINLPSIDSDLTRFFESGCNNCDSLLTQWQISVNGPYPDLLNLKVFFFHSLTLISSHIRANRLSDTNKV